MNSDRSKVETGRARRFLGSLFLAVATLVAPPAGATRQVPLAPEQLATAAECIVKGVVHSLEVHRDAADRIVTRVIVTIEETWKAPARTAQVEIELGGGTLGEVRVASSEFTWPGVGDAAVWFLLRNPAGKWSVVGMDQGCYRIAAPLREDSPVWNSQSATARPGLPPPLEERLRFTLRDLRRRVLGISKEGA